MVFSGAGSGEGLYGARPIVAVQREFRTFDIAHRVRRPRPRIQRPNTLRRRTGGGKEDRLSALEHVIAGIAARRVWVTGDGHLPLYG